MLVAAIRKAELRPLGVYLVKRVEAELRSEDLPPESLGRLDPDGVQLAKTASRSILGFMNEMAVHCDYAVADAGGLSGCDVGALNHRLRRTLHNRGCDYVSPLELVAVRAREDFPADTVPPASNPERRATGCAVAERPRRPNRPGSLTSTGGAVLLFP